MESITRNCTRKIKWKYGSLEGLPIVEGMHEPGRASSYRKEATRGG